MQRLLNSLESTGLHKQLGVWKHLQPNECTTLSLPSGDIQDSFYFMINESCLLMFPPEFIPSIHPHALLDHITFTAIWG